MDDGAAKKKFSAQMLLQVHDELVFEVPDKEVEKTLPVVTSVMVEAPLPALSLVSAAPGRSARRRQLGRGALIWAALTSGGYFVRCAASLTIL